MSIADVPPPPPQQGSDGVGGGGRSGLPRWVLPVVLVVAVLAVTATGTVAVRQHREIERLRADLAEAEERIAELEEGGGGLGELFGELFGDGGGGLEELLEGGLDGLLDGLLEGDGGGPDDLTGGVDPADLAQCLGGDGMGGLLGGGDPIVADDLPSQIDAIADRVEDIRGLELSEPVEPALLPSAEFTALIVELVREDYPEEDADLDRRVLSALGAVGGDVDLRAMLVELVGEQAAGFYNTDTGQLVVRADDPDELLGPSGQVVLAHELQHAAADQRFGLPDDPDAPADGDADRAGLALVEGDATLFMQHFTLDAFDMMEQLGMATDPSVAGSQEQLEGYPEYLQRELVFPYTEGLAFACDLYAEGGWAAVDEAYANLPTTTAQVLWPERYTAAEGPVDVAALGSPGGAWSQERSSTIGAADLLWLFSAPGDDADAALDEPRDRAAAWAGGQLALWTDGAASAVGIALAQRPGERDLCASMTDWYDAAFPDAEPADPSGEEALAVSGPDQDAVIVCDGDGVRVGIAPDLATARRVTG